MKQSVNDRDCLSDYSENAAGFDLEGEISDFECLLNPGSCCYRTGDLLIDKDRKTIYQNGRIISLGKIEFSMVLCLIINAPRSCTRDLLLNTIGSHHKHYSLKNNTLSKHIERIRFKLGSFRGHSYITTHHSVGYQWSLPVEKCSINGRWVSSPRVSLNREKKKKDQEDDKNADSH